MYIYSIKKKYFTKKIIFFQIKQKQRNIFNLLKKNRKNNKNFLKKCAFKRFKFACDFNKEEIINKNNLFNNAFCRILYTKCGIISFKNFLLNKKILNEQNKICYKKMKLFNNKNNFKFFLCEIKKEIKIKKIYYKYNKYILNQNYIIFFKFVAKKKKTKKRASQKYLFI